MGPPPSDPSDPELWDWSETEDELPPRRRRLRVLLAVVLMVAMVVLVVASVV